MSKVIIYKQDNGQIAVVYPMPEWVAKVGIDAIAKKDVPAGKRYRIIDESELPTNAPQEAWMVDDADLTDGVGAQSNEFPPEVLERTQ